jgi:hypothetical protein
LADNALCGVNADGEGTYTTEGITKMCEGLKGGAVTSLKCAATPECLLLCQRPLTLAMCHHPHPFPCCSLGSNNLTNFGRDMSGLLKLVEILPQTKIESLECALAP